MANCSLACTPNSRPPTAVPNIRDRTPDMCQMSPPSSISSSNQSGIGARIRKKATVTPRTFTRFFTPRSLLESGKTIGASRQALRDITASTVNDKNLTRQASRYKNATTELGNDLSFKDIRIQKRKALDTPETTPERSSPPKKCREGYFSGHSAEIGLLDSLLSDSEDEYNQEQEDSDDEDPEVVESQPIYSLNPLIRSRYHGQLGRVLRGEVNNSPQFSLASRYGYVDNWQSHTTNFYSNPDDCHKARDIVSPPHDLAMPFSAIGCNTNSLMAVGYEEGYIRLLDPAHETKHPFKKSYIAWQPHVNAIIDMDFSQDDMLLATASGDQSARVIDMMTQKVIHILVAHTSSVKQVRFQPGSSSVIATGGRDGTIFVWDIRCSSHSGPTSTRACAFKELYSVDAKPEDKLNWLRPVNYISDAHAPKWELPTLGLNMDSPPKNEMVKERRGEVSITALSFLKSPGREHLLLSGCEANAQIKLWDLRMTGQDCNPLSTTPQPESHTKHRPFGLTSFAVSGDGSRVYSLCRDNTVYAYSTSHLMLGHSAELSNCSARTRRPDGPEVSALGPLYGLRHPKFHVSSFYCKLSLRPATEDKSELLAVGSADACAIVFPTDERYFKKPINAASLTPSIKYLKNNEPLRPSIARRSSSFSRLNDTIPIHQIGSALIGGHSKEVGSVAWSKTGDLITLGDDMAVRKWRDDGNGRKVRWLREKARRRIGHGWAECEEEWDMDDG